MSAPDPDRLNAAADRGMLAAFWAAENPDAPAVISEAGNRTRAEVNANANRLVRALRARGVKDGDGIALLCSNRPEYFETVAAAQRAGLRLTIVNWHLTGDEAGYIVDDCEATAFVADARFALTAPAPPSTSRPGCGPRYASAAMSKDSNRGQRCWPPSRVTTSTTRLPAERCSTRRARPVGRKACAAAPIRAARSAWGN